MFRFTTAAALTVVLSTSALAEMTVEDAYARSSNPRAGAAFMVITNSGESDDRLIAVKSGAAVRIELHTHVEEDGIMRMMHVEDGFEIPAGGSLYLKRGAEHLMFMGLNAPFEQGATVSVTLVFQSGIEMPIEIPVDNDRMDSMAPGN